MEFGAIDSVGVSEQRNMGTKDEIERLDLILIVVRLRGPYGECRCSLSGARLGLVLRLGDLGHLSDNRKSMAGPT